jgi:hypothetical protein
MSSTNCLLDDAHEVERASTFGDLVDDHGCRPTPAADWPAARGARLLRRQAHPPPRMRCTSCGRGTAGDLAVRSLTAHRRAALRFDGQPSTAPGNAASVRVPPPRRPLQHCEHQATTRPASPRRGRGVRRGANRPPGGGAARLRTWTAALTAPRW